MSTIRTFAVGLFERHSRCYFLGNKYMFQRCGFMGGWHNDLGMRFGGIN
jgi:hypothetical protein